MTSDARWIEPDWPAAPGVRALCTLRTGGVSVADFATFNLGDHVGDSVEAVAANRHQLVADADLPAEPLWLNQVHGVGVADLDCASGNSTARTADAGVATRSSVVCAILTADCLPVLFAAHDGGAVGAAHAGWRGLAAGVLEATVGVLRKRVGPDEPLRAWLGPAIGPARFEVGDEVRSAFLRHELQAEKAFTPNSAGRWDCDLYALARQRLAAVGVTDISGGDFCTYTEQDRFFSHRRDVQHAGARSTGRMATLIWRQER